MNPFQICLIVFVGGMTLLCILEKCFTRKTSPPPLPKHECCSCCGSFVANFINCPTCLGTSRRLMNHVEAFAVRERYNLNHRDTRKIEIK